MEYQKFRIEGYDGDIISPSSFFSGLSGFSLRFNESDHKIKFLSIGGTTGTVQLDRHDFTIGMYDKSQVLEQRDVYTACMQFLMLDGITEEFAMGRFEGVRKGTIPINPMGPEDLFILRGFSFEQTGDHDHNIRKISLQLNNSRNGIEVEFFDNSPNDDGFEVKIIYGRVLDSAASYNTRETFTGPFNAAKDFTVETVVDQEFRGKVLLTGFSFEFTDTDHFIREITVDPNDPDHPGGIKLVFTDDERDNPVKANIDYVVYRIVGED